MTVSRVMNEPDLVMHHDFHGVDDAGGVEAVGKFRGNAEGGMYPTVTGTGVENFLGYEERFRDGEDVASVVTGGQGGAGGQQRRVGCGGDGSKVSECSLGCRAVKGEVGDEAGEWLAAKGSVGFIVDAF